eukprot:CAMPEP_0170632474 /NCGR_PEP_ID=MMETSP0224-20130122/35345_1 /TAXON_ID=285029 /ORGANISM="Togula jolla, Strain CCCM 725" /LENGTH=107 /DNA_ID=CAMNT_0010961185 /DNA_START=383 /DNA_END=705 /DNA_ORIENTATION=-
MDRSSSSLAKPRRLEAIRHAEGEDVSQAAAASCDQILSAVTGAAIALAESGAVVAKHRRNVFAMVLAVEADRQHPQQVITLLDGLFRDSRHGRPYQRLLWRRAVRGH